MRTATPASSTSRSKNRRTEPTASGGPPAGTEPTVELDAETIARLDSLRVEDESYDEIVTELSNIYEAEELTLFHSGD
jgi:hypothetical protein